MIGENSRLCLVMVRLLFLRKKCLGVRKSVLVVGGFWVVVFVVIVVSRVNKMKWWIFGLSMIFF